MTPTDAHRAFLNRYYGVSRHFYDATRRYYLLGRDEELTELALEPWQSLLEIGFGTGRNLRALHAARPSARLGGIDASDEMLEHARFRCSWATLHHGFAETADLRAVLGGPVDRVLLSYCLSMVRDPEAALANARDALAPGGQVVVVDFGDFESLPSAFGRGFERWLGAFHVRPIAQHIVDSLGGRVAYGSGRYYLRARIPAAR